MTFRTKIFTPHALSQSHRDLIYKPTRHKILLNDPGVTVTMSDDEEIRLLPMNSRDRPNKKQSLQRLLDLLQDARDWRNLPAFLEGMQLAGESLPNGYMQRFVRRANEQGQAGIIIRCAEMVKKTGVTLADPEPTRELMLGIHLRAVRAGFKGDEMRKAVHQAGCISLLLEKPEHCGGKVWKADQQDMRKDITVLGIMLELRAATATHADPDHPQLEGGLALETVPKAASKVMALWPHQDITVDADPVKARLQLEKWLPLWAGMKLALKVDDVKQSTTLSRQLQQAVHKLSQSIEQAREKVEQASQGRPRRCLHMWNDVKDL